MDFNQYDASSDFIISELSKLAVIGKLTAEKAHEMSTPLASILLLANQIELALDDGNLNPEEIKSITAKIQFSVNRVSTITKGLVEFARSNNCDPFEEVKAQELVQRSIDFYQDQARLNLIEIRNLAEAGCFLECRPVDLAFAFGNLIKNSIESFKNLPTQQANREIKILIRDTDSCIEFTFADNGPGIPDDCGNRIFEAFFSKGKEASNIGLGLYTAQRTIERHRGEIKLLPSGKGAVFLIRIPKKQISKTKPAFSS